jgi:hypothetical protein
VTLNLRKSNFIKIKIIFSIYPFYILLMLFYNSKKKRFSQIEVSRISTENWKYQ